MMEWTMAKEVNAHHFAEALMAPGLIVPRDARGH